MSSDGGIKTYISQAYWCSPDGEYKAASFPASDGTTKKEIFWFDDLFDGGIAIPEDFDNADTRDCGRDRSSAERKRKKKMKRPLFFLLSGPPGSGKSTLALEICHRLASKEKFNSLYISSESESWKLKIKATSYGWEKSKSTFECVSDNCVRCFQSHSAKKVCLWGMKDGFSKIKVSGDDKKQIKEIGSFLKICQSIVWLLSPFMGFDSSHVSVKIFLAIKFLLRPLLRFLPSAKKVDNKFGVLVVDSLNVVPDQKRGKLFDKLHRGLEGGPELVIFVLDSGSNADEHQYWEHVCDVIVRMDYHVKDVSEYYIRTIEVIKARYQSHVWGKHQLKIYPSNRLMEEFVKNKIGEIYSDAVRGKEEIEKYKRDYPDDWPEKIIDHLKDVNPDNDNPLLKEYHEQLRRAHPYRKEGGIFIFPSIHWFLSRYKRRSPSHNMGLMPTHSIRLNEVLWSTEDEAGGFPRGRCTAIVGSRGAHKSHLGYTQLLHNIYMSHVNNTGQERALIISLRDDEVIAKKAMGKILKRIMGTENSDETSAMLNKFINNDWLEILYFPPGYITPEEFYHRVLMSLFRLKRGSMNQTDVKVTVLFNSLDQLFARFPLCSREDVFIPGLIDTFTAEGITSIVIAVDEPGQPEHQYGLLTMADLIISANQYILPSASYFGHLENCWLRHPDRIPGDLKAPFGDLIPTVTLRVERFAGGKRAGDGGILELVQNDNLTAVYDSILTKCCRESMAEGERETSGKDDLKSGLVFTPFSSDHDQGYKADEFRKAVTIDSEKKRSDCRDN